MLLIVVTIAVSIAMLTACFETARTLTVSPNAVSIADANLSDTVTVGGTQTGNITLDYSALPNGVVATLVGTDANIISIIGTRPTAQGATITGTHNLIVRRGDLYRIVAVTVNLTTTYGEPSCCDNGDPVGDDCEYANCDCDDDCLGDTCECENDNGYYNGGQPSDGCDYADCSCGDTCMGDTCECDDNGYNNGTDPTPTLTLANSTIVVADTNHTAGATTTLGGTATGTIYYTYDTLLPVTVSVNQTTGVVTVTATRPSGEGAIISGNFTIAFTREGQSATLTVQVNLSSTWVATVILNPSVVNIDNDNLSQTVTLTGSAVGNIALGYVLSGDEVTHITISHNNTAGTVTITATRPTGQNAAPINTTIYVDVVRGATGARATLTLNVNLTTTWVAPTLNLSQSTIYVTDANYALGATATIGGTATSTIGYTYTTSLPIAVSVNQSTGVITVTATRPTTDVAPIIGSVVITITRGGLNVELTVNVNISSTYVAPSQLSSPTGLRRQGGSGAMTWNAVANATSYRVYKLPHRAAAWSYFGTVSTTSIINVFGGVAGTNPFMLAGTHYIRVVAESSNSLFLDSDFSFGRIVRIGGQFVDVPTAGTTAFLPVPIYTPAPFVPPVLTQEHWDRAEEIRQFLSDFIMDDRVPYRTAEYEPVIEAPAHGLYLVVRNPLFVSILRNNWGTVVRVFPSNYLAQDFYNHQAGVNWGISENVVFLNSSPNQPDIPHSQRTFAVMYNFIVHGIVTEPPCIFSHADQQMAIDLYNELLRHHLIVASGIANGFDLFLIGQTASNSIHGLNQMIAIRIYGSASQAAKSIWFTNPIILPGFESVVIGEGVGAETLAIIQAQLNGTPLPVRAGVSFTPHIYLRNTIAEFFRIHGPSGFSEMTTPTPRHCYAWGYAGRRPYPTATRFEFVEFMVFASHAVANNIYSNLNLTGGFVARVFNFYVNGVPVAIIAFGPADGVATIVQALIHFGHYDPNASNGNDILTFGELQEELENAGWGIHARNLAAMPNAVAWIGASLSGSFGGHSGNIVEFNTREQALAHKNYLIGQWYGDYHSIVIFGNIVFSSGSMELIAAIYALTGGAVRIITPLNIDLNAAYAMFNVLANERDLDIYFGTFKLELDGVMVTGLSVQCEEIDEGVGILYFPNSTAADEFWQGWLDMQDQWLEAGIVMYRHGNFLWHGIAVSDLLLQAFHNLIGYTHN